MLKTKNSTGWWAIFLIYLRLGCLSFGGPVAHLGYFKDEFVNRRKWLDEARFAELLGLCQFVPGPSSSQLGFAIGWHRDGLKGASAAWFGFTLPSACIMVAFAYGLFALGDSTKALTHGLLVAAVAIVTKATLGLGGKLCPDLPRIAIALFASACALNFPGTLTQISVILIGAMIGRKLASEPTAGNQTIKYPSGSHADATDRCQRPKGISPTGTLRSIGIVALIVYVILLAACFLMNDDIYALHYRAGALVFGGGHVVLPLLNESVVASGLVSKEIFLAGYSAAQALPGPLFTFAAFLGTVGAGTSPAAVGGLLTLAAIFLPGLLLLIGLLPFWNTIRKKQAVQAALKGANAAVVGLLLAALISPVWMQGIQTRMDFTIGALAFIALYRYKIPAWTVVPGCALAGYIFY